MLTSPFFYRQRSSRNYSPVPRSKKFLTPQFGARCLRQLKTCETSCASWHRYAVLLAEEKMSPGISVRAYRRAPYRGDLLLFQSIKTHPLIMRYQDFNYPGVFRLRASDTCALAASPRIIFRVWRRFYQRSAVEPGAADDRTRYR